jgi:hypothetical protein
VNSEKCKMKTEPCGEHSGAQGCTCKLKTENDKCKMKNGGVRVAAMDGVFHSVRYGFFCRARLGG